MTTYEQTIDIGSTRGSVSSAGEMPTSARPFSLDLEPRDQLVGGYYGTPLNIDYSPGALSGIIGKNQIAPVISNVSPAAGTIARTTSIALRITDDEGELQKVIVLADFSSGGTETIFDGSTFQPGYTAGSSATPVTNGFDYVFAADSGWWRSFTLRTLAVDNDGNIATSNAALSYTVSNPAADVASTLSNVAPTNGASVLSADALTFDLTHALARLGRVILLASYTGGGSEVVHDGTSFADAFTSSTRSSITNGYSFSLERDDGWPQTDLDFLIIAEDTSGGDDQLTLGFTVTDPPPPPDTTGPTVSNVAPAAGTAISRTAPLTFDVTDDGTFRRVLVCVRFASGYEVVHDGDDFAPGYVTLSTRVAISGGYRYRVRRGAGWAEAPTVRVFAFDVAGNEV